MTMSGSEGWEEHLEAAKEGPGSGAGMMMIMASPAPLETWIGKGTGRGPPLPSHVAVEVTGVLGPTAGEQVPSAPYPAGVAVQ